jgi:hypothetical protein
MKRNNNLCCFALALVCIAASATGCSYSASGGLPEHIQTVRVNMIRNDTMYRGVEGDLTRALIQKLARDSRLRVVQEGADAVLSGEITAIEKRVLRETQRDDPAETRLTVVAEITFEDKVQGTKLLDRKRFSSSSTSSAAGVYNVRRQESSSMAEADAIDEVSTEIVRRTAGMW